MMNATGGAAGFDGASLDQDMLDSLPEGQVDKPDIKDLSQAAKMAGRIGQRYRREPSDRRGRYADPRSRQALRIRRSADSAAP